jgi:hypothetical protein
LGLAGFRAFADSALVFAGRFDRAAFFFFAAGKSR